MGPSTPSAIATMPQGFELRNGYTKDDIAACFSERGAILINRMLGNDFAIAEETEIEIEEEIAEDGIDESEG